MALSFAGTAALTFVLTQLLVTLVFHFGAMSNRCGQMDLLGIIPRWKFFIHARGVYDLAICFRERTSSGSVGDWRTIWRPRSRSRLSWLWDPEAFTDGIVWLTITTLEARLLRGKPANAEASASYAMILDLCRREIRFGDRSVEGQFALRRTAPDRDWTELFVSPCHIF